MAGPRLRSQTAGAQCGVLSQRGLRLTLRVAAFTPPLALQVARPGPPALFQSVAHILPLTHP